MGWYISLPHSSQTQWRPIDRPAHTKRVKVSSYSIQSAISIVIRTIKHIPKGRSCLVNNLYECPCSSWKKLNVGRSLTGCLSKAHVNSHMPCLAPAMLCLGLAKSPSEWHVQSTAGAWHGMCESHTTALCKSNGEDTI